MARNSGAKRIRVMQGGLVDEEGQRWDRIRSGNYYLTPADVASLGHVSRFLTTGSYGTPAVEVTRAQFEAALAAGVEQRVTGHRSSRGDGAVTLLLDTSDC
jgi:hypothetical protein